MKLVVPCLLAVAVGTWSSAAGAQTTTFRCQNDLVKVGDAKSSVQLKCGRPMLTDSFCKPADGQAPPRRSGAKVVINAGCETVDEWTYNPGYGQFITTLRFESGRLVSISYGDRVQ